MTKEEKGLAVNPTGQRNPNTSRFFPRKLQLHIYGLISVLVLTLALIAILEYVNRSLPDESKTQYSPQLRIRKAFEPDRLPVLAARDTSSVLNTDSSMTGTEFFVPVMTTLTISMSQCPAPPLTCACPPDAITDCICTPDPSATVCTCTVKVNPSCGCDPADIGCSCPNPYYRECVCPPDSKCTRCQCPGSGSYYVPCECPPDPYAAGCDSNPRAPVCSNSTGECGCSVVQEWSCGSGVTRSDCSVPTSTIAGFSVSTITTSEASSSPPFTPSSNTSQAYSSTTFEPFTISSSSPGRLSSISNTSQPVSTPVTTSLSTPAPTPAIATPPSLGSSISSMTVAVGTKASISLVVSASSPKPPGTSISSTLPNPQVVTSISSPPSPLAATPSSTTSSSSALALITSGVGTAIGSLTTLASSPLGPGVIILVSFTLLPATSGPASSRVAAITFLRTTPPPSVSLITGPSGSVYTIPSILLATSPALTPTDQVTPPISSGPATSVAPTSSLASVTSLTPPNPTASGLGSSALTSPPSIRGTLPSINLLASVSSIESLGPGSSEAVVSVSPSAKSSGTTAPGTLQASNPPPTTATLTNGAASVSVGVVGSGGSKSTFMPSPTPSTGTSAVTVAVYSWPVSKTVLGGYIPIIFARLLHGGWTAIHGHLTQHEAVNQLVGHNGASSSVLFGTGLALWYIWPAYIAVWCVSPFASEVIYFDTNYGCANPNPDAPTNPCWPPIMSVNVWVVRVLQTLLLIVAITIVVLIVLWFKRPSGSDGDPTSIAAVAEIMGHPEVEQDFREFDAEISIMELKEKLKDKKYQLSIYQTEANTERYGIVPVPPEADDAQNADLANPRRGLASSAAVSWIKMGFNFVTNWKGLQMGCDIIFMLYLLGIFGTTILYLSHINNMTVIHLFDGSTVGRRLLFATLACVASSYWARLQRDAQTLAPYADLAYPNLAPPQPTILFRKSSLAITALFPLLRYRHFTAALTAFTAVLSEFLIVALSGMPYRPGQLRGEFLFCGIASLAVLIFMIIMLLVVNLWRMLAVPHLPRKPDNIAAVMTYVCNSAMNKDFEGVERVDLKERDKQIRGLGKKYRYGLRRDNDGKERWAVDEASRAADTES